MYILFIEDEFYAHVWFLFIEHLVFETVILKAAEGRK
jgi:hypothetical protein